MADNKISQLTEQTSLDDTADEFVVVDDSAGATERITWGNLRTAIASYIASLAQTLTNKTIDGDDNTISDIAVASTKLSAGTGLSLSTDTLNADSATTSAAGISELATAAETTTGTDAARAVTPDGLAGSDFGKRIVSIKVFSDTDTLTTGDGKFHYFVPTELAGMNIVDVSAGVSTVSSSGNPTVQIHNVTSTADVLSVALTIDANEKHSSTAATAHTIDTDEDDVAEGDELRIDVDTAGTGAQGLQVDIVLQLP